MPLTKKKPASDEVYVCSEAFSITVDGVPATVPAGERRRGDDSLVRDHFQFWVADGEQVSVVPPLSPPEHQAKRQPYDALVYEALLPIDGVVLKRRLRVAHAQHDRITVLEPGSILAPEAELVRLLPDAFARPSVGR